jgi:hypothetical protein
MASPHLDSTRMGRRSLLTLISSLAVLLSAVAINRLYSTTPSTDMSTADADYRLPSNVVPVSLPLVLSLLAAQRMPR